MTTLAKCSSVAALAILLFLPGIAGAACNDANGTQYILEIGGYVDSTVELGVTNTFTLRIKNAYTGVYLTTGQIDAGAITWNPGVFTVVDSNGDELVNDDDLHVISIKLVAQAGAVSTSVADTKAIVCQYEPIGWYSTSGGPCQVSTAKLCIDTDWDGDGLTYLEEDVLGTDPNNADSDSDGLPDGYEALPGLGLNPMDPSDATQEVLDAFAALTGDPDGDSKPDWYELVVGTNPDDFFD